MLKILPQPDAGPTPSFSARALPKSESSADKDCMNVNDPDTSISIEKAVDCLGTVVSRYLAAYLDEHKNHLPIGKLYSLVMSEVEKSLIKETLILTQGNQRKASEILGINRNTLRKKQSMMFN